MTATPTATPPTICKCFVNQTDIPSIQPSVYICIYLFESFKKFETQIKTLNIRTNIY